MERYPLAKYTIWLIIFFGSFNYSVNGQTGQYRYSEDESFRFESISLFSNGKAEYFHGVLDSHTYFKNQGSFKIKRNKIIVTLNGWEMQKSSYEVLIDSSKTELNGSGGLMSIQVNDQNGNTLSNVSIFNSITKLGGSTNNVGLFSPTDLDIQGDIKIQQVGKDWLTIPKTELPSCQCNYSITVVLVDASQFKEDERKLKFTFDFVKNGDEDYLVQRGTKKEFLKVGDL